MGCTARPRRCTFCRAVIHEPYVKRLYPFLAQIASIAPDPNTVALSLDAVRGRPISVEKMFNAFVAFNGGVKPVGFQKRDMVAAIKAILSSSPYAPPPTNSRSGESVTLPPIVAMRATLASNVSPAASEERLQTVNAMHGDGLLVTHPTKCFQKLMGHAVAIRIKMELPGGVTTTALNDLDGLLSVLCACALRVRDVDGIKASETTGVLFAAFELFRPSFRPSTWPTPTSSSTHLTREDGNAMWWGLLHHMCKLRPAFDAVPTALALLVEAEAVTRVPYPASFAAFKIGEFTDVLAGRVATSPLLAPALRDAVLAAYPRALISAVADLRVAKTLPPEMLVAGVFLARDALASGAPHTHHEADTAVPIGVSVALARGVPVHMPTLCGGLTAAPPGAMIQTLRAIGATGAPPRVAAAMAVAAWDPRVDKGEWEAVVRTMADRVGGAEAMEGMAEFFVRNGDKESVRGVTRALEWWSGLK